MTNPRALPCVVFNVGRNVLVSSFDIGVIGRLGTRRGETGRRKCSSRQLLQVGVSDKTPVISRFSSPPTSKRRTAASGTSTSPGHILSCHLTQRCWRSRAPTAGSRVSSVPRGGCCQTLRACVPQPTINARRTYINRFHVSPFKSVGTFTIGKQNKKLSVKVLDAHQYFVV